MCRIRRKKRDLERGEECKQAERRGQDPEEGQTTGRGKTEQVTPFNRWLEDAFVCH